MTRASTAKNETLAAVEKVLSHPVKIVIVAKAEAITPCAFSFRPDISSGHKTAVSRSKNKTRRERPGEEEAQVNEPC